tara:strand:+ start:38 stop:199 length:162 start_codon:yes stop_codon:yes gene_type:complete
MLNQEKNLEELKEWCIDKVKLIDSYEVQIYFKAWHWAAGLSGMLLLLIVLAMH